MGANLELGGSSSTRDGARERAFTLASDGQSERADTSRADGYRHAVTDSSSEEAGDPVHRSRSGVRWWVLTGVVVLGLVAGGWGLAQQVQSTDQAVSRAAPPEASWVTAVVERRVLAQTVISRGDVRPQVSVDVGAPSSVEGDPVVTRVGVAVGDEVGEGARLLEVSGRPVFVLGGDVPVYRSLRPGMSGADVAQLQDALARLGYAPDRDGVFGEATKVAVAALYEAAGYEPVPTSDNVAANRAAAEQVLADAEAALEDAEAELAGLRDGGVSSSVVSARVELDAARRGVNDTVAGADTAIVLAQQQYDVAAVENHRVVNDPETEPAEREQAGLAVSQAAGTLEQALRDKASEVAAANDRVRIAEASIAEAEASSNVDAVTRARDKAVTARDRALAALWTLNATSGPTVSQGEIVFAPTLPARVQSAVTTLGPIGSRDPVGIEAGSGGELVSLAGGSLVVSMHARPGDVALMRVEMPVELLDEQNDFTYPATITEIADAATSGADGQLGYQIVVTPDDTLPAELAGVNVRVTITAASTQTETLVVPLAAVSSAADGSTRVSVLGSHANEPVDVSVTAGLSADGFVAVEPIDPDALGVGDRVVVGR